MAETVGFRIKIDGADELTKTELRLAEINKELREAKKQQNTPVYGKLRREQLALQETAKGLRKDIRNQIKDWQDVKKGVPTDSLVGLSKRYRELVENIKLMSKAQRQSDFGKRAIAEAKAVKDELDKVQQSYGNFRGNVGNYRSALGSGLDGLLGGGAGGLVGGAVAGAATGTLMAQGAMVAATALKNVLVDATNIVLDYDEANANLNAILAKNASETQRLREQQQELGATTAFTSTEVAQLQTELAKLGFTESEIIDSAQGIVQFAVATQAEVPRAAALAGAALRSFNLDASETQRVVEVLATSTTRSSLDFGKLETALPIVGGVASQFGKSIEDVAAQLAVLTDRGIDASTAATSLRNIYLKSAQAGLTFEEALIQVNNAQDPVNEAFQLFGNRGALQATILAQNTDEVKNLTDGLTDLNGELEDMTERQLESVRGKMTLLRSAWTGLILNIEDGTGAIGGFAKEVIGQLTNTLNVINRLSVGTLSWSTALGFLFKDAQTVNDELAKMTKREQELAKVRSENAKEVEGTLGEIMPWFFNSVKEGSEQSQQTLSELEKQINSLSYNTINGLNAKVKELREGLGDLEIGSDAYNKQQSELNELQKKLDAAQGKVNKRMKEAKESYPVGSIAAMEASMRELNNEINKATDRTIIVELIGQSVELGEKIKAAKDELFAIEDAARGGQLARDLESEINRDYTHRTIKDKKAADAEVAKVDKNRLNEQISNLEFLKKLEIQAEKEASEEIRKLKQRQDEEERKMEKKRLDEELRRLIQIEEEKKRVKWAAMNALADATFDVLYSSSQRQLDEEVKSLHKQYEQRIKAAEGQADLQKKLQEELAAKEEDIQRKGFERNKKQQIAEALIKGALAALQALSNTTLPFPASLIGPAIVAGQTAAQIAVISQQSFDEGGFTGYKGISDQKVPGRKIVGVVHDNEYVAPTDQIKKYPQLFKALDRERRGFAEGGFTSPVLPQLDYEAMLMGNLVAHELNKGLFGVGSNDMIRQAIFEGAKEGARIGAMEGAKAGTTEGAKEGSKEGVIEASRETEFSRIRTERVNKNLKE